MCNIKSKRYIIMLFVIAMLCLVGCCSHEWEEANCTTPKTCKNCGATEGDVVHVFNDAHCEEDVICTLCGHNIGAMPHNLDDATCTEPRKCIHCGIVDGEPAGHSTKYGKCTRCNEIIDEVEKKDGYIVVTLTDTIWISEQDDFLDVYVSGTISDINKANDFTVVDSEGGTWIVDIGTGQDFSAYIGKKCEVYGFSGGEISSTHKTPLINMNHEDNHIVFFDGKKLYPEDYESIKQFPDKNGSSGNGGIGKVWVPTKGGTKYHSKSSCSGMEEPIQMPEEEAIKEGYSKCGKCW